MIIHIQSGLCSHLFLSQRQAYHLNLLSVKGGLHPQPNKNHQHASHRFSRDPHSVVIGYAISLVFGCIHPDCCWDHTKVVHAIIFYYLLSLINDRNSLTFKSSDILGDYFFFGSSPPIPTTNYSDITHLHQVSDFTFQHSRETPGEMQMQRSICLQRWIWKRQCHANLPFKVMVFTYHDHGKYDIYDGKKWVNGLNY